MDAKINRKQPICPYSVTNEIFKSTNDIPESGQRIYNTDTREWYTGDGVSPLRKLEPSSDSGGVDLTNYKKKDFIINIITADGEIYTADKTFKETIDAYNEGRNVNANLIRDGVSYIFRIMIANDEGIVFGSVLNYQGEVLCLFPDNSIFAEAFDYEKIENKVQEIECEYDVPCDEYPSVHAVTTYVNDKIRNKADKQIIRNLFNPDDSEIEDGYYIYHNNTKYENNRCFVSGYIPVIKGKTYIFNRPYGTYGGNMVNHPYYNQNKEYTGVLKGTYEGNMCTITIPEDIDIAYIRTSYYLEEKSSYMVIEGNIYPDSYLGYNESQSYIPKDITIFADKFKDADNAIIDISPLKNKNITFNGDSICAGTGDVLGGYGKLIAERYSMTYQNIAASGATIAKGTYTDEANTKPRRWICDTISSMAKYADYAIVEGGVNDASLKVPLGAITTTFHDELDETTFYGAFESMLKQLTIKYAGKKIGYIAVHQMQNDFSAAGDEATSYYYAAKKCCEKWGVPFLDLNVSVPPFGLIHDEGDDAELVALKTAYTINGDGWHLNKDGYNIYYVPKIIKWLESL